MKTNIKKTTYSISINTLFIDNTLLIKKYREYYLFKIHIIINLKRENKLQKDWVFEIFSSMTLSTAAKNKKK